MQKKKQPKQNNITTETQIGGTIIAEIPISEDQLDFEFNRTQLPVIPLDDVVPFPGLPQPIRIKDEEMLSFLEWAHKSRECILAMPKKEDGEKGDRIKDFYPVGTICKVWKIINIPGAEKVGFLIGGERARLTKIMQKGQPVIAAAKPLGRLNPIPDRKMLPILMEELKKQLDRLFSFANTDEKERLGATLEGMEEDPVRCVYFLANNTPLSVSERAYLLMCEDETSLIEKFMQQIDSAIQKLEIQAEIHRRTHEDMLENQKRMFLEQQIRSIKSELGETEDDDEHELLERAAKKNWPEKARHHFDKEYKKLLRYNRQSPDYSVQYTYIDTLLNLPWDSFSSEEFTLDKVQEVLDKDHYGLEKVKERIIEQMAVIKLRNDLKAPILCLYGPPGVGKTSLGRSIAKAIGREYSRISLGGVHDEAEIRGHRRTYIGAMPGRILSALAKCGTGNPVFVLDEIDKIGKDFKGDPSTALLEVLDPEQNSHFHDNYIDFDYDLSKVLFIATANSLSEISGPLLDRMEIIEIGGYIPEEKLEIAKRHLIPKALADTGFNPDEITFTDDAISLIIDRYTRESGVRQLEKKIASALRKVARSKASGREFPTVIDSGKVREFLGKEIVNPDTYENNCFAGVVTGLAWTQAGGDILFIESSLSPGNGEKLTLTGNLGDVMKESAAIALQYLRAHADKLGIDPELFNKKNVHIHVPEGAIPKDGPSAGITMATSLASAFTGRKVRDHLAMTGEMTLRGKVLPVGGIKEKILAAKRAGITDIILSAENRRDIEEINERYLSGLDFHYVNTLEEVMDFALLSELAENRFTL